MWRNLWRVQITPHPDTPILTLNRTGVMVVMLGEGGVTVERMDMMAEGEGVIGGG